MKLVIGDKNLSSWSMRAWLVAKISGVPFEEILIPLDRPETARSLDMWSPSKKVPCLVDEELSVWDSLAIAEYFAEAATNKNLWPKDSKQRAIARSYVSEMHSGFQSLRSQLSMDIRLRMEVRHLTSGTIQDIERILFLWNQALKNSTGPFLFGEFGIVDAFYAPVVMRFISYGVKIESEKIKQYMQNVVDHKYVNEWIEAGTKETPSLTVFKI